MVATVAVVRLFLGTLIGLGSRLVHQSFWTLAGYTHLCRAGRPVLIVALGAIAMLGADIGLLAFIVRFIHQWMGGDGAYHPRPVPKLQRPASLHRSCPGLGCFQLLVLGRHILRQIMPMVWMLFAFEISNTLMTTAGLGFLGYFIGGDIWIEVSDFVSRRVSGMPELGQMLATSWVNLIQPWPLVITGTIVFVSVLQINLMGEGLRAPLTRSSLIATASPSRFGRWFGAWFEQRVSYPSGIWLRRSPLNPIMVGVMVIGLTGIPVHDG